MEEIWRKIEGYDYYMVSNCGRVLSLKNRHGKKQMIKIKTNDNGYCSVGLYLNKKCKYHLVHRLVAQAFIPNPNNYPVINHRDENKQNNFVWVNEDGSVDYEKSNLEWCTQKYNINYGNRTDRVRKKTIGTKKNYCGSKNHNSKPIEQYDLDGNLLNTFDCAADAEKYLGLKVYSSHIRSVCNGKLKQSCGFKWKWC